MKTKIYNSFVLGFILLFGLFACTDDDFVPEVSVEEGIPVKVHLSFDVPGRKTVVTRSPKEETESHIDDLHVYIFSKSTGKLIGYTNQFTPDPVTVAQQQALTGTVSVETVTGEAYIFAIANMKTTQYWVDPAMEERLLVTDVKTSTLTKDEFLGINYVKQAQALLPLDKRFLMSGGIYGTDQITPVSVTINKSGEVLTIDGANPKISLYSVLSKNQFNIKMHPDSTDCEFKLLAYTLHNVATGGNLLPKALPGGSTSAVEDLGFSQHDGEGNNFMVYIPENIHTSSKSINAWKEREQDSYSAGNGREFVNAPEKSTYVKLYGKYLDTKNRWASDVVYTFHLGDFGANTPDALKNFKVERGTKYIYNITIYGVHDIRVEAIKQTENPYAEGEVVDYSSNGFIFNLDSHYEERVIRFGRKKAKELRDRTTSPGSGYVLYTRTAFGESKNLRVAGKKIYDIEDLDDKLLCDLSTQNLDDVAQSLYYSGVPDFKWIHFVKHTAENGTTYPCDYPGDGNGQVIDVFTLLNDLYVHAQDEVTNNTFWNFDSGDDHFAYYTCFIDENYYADKPWNKYVNKPERLMHIAKDLKLSSDRHSIFAQVLYTFTQKSILTPYALNKATGQYPVKAFGVASVSDEAEQKINYSKADYDLRDAPNIQDPWNGWTVAKTNWIGKSWSEYKQPINGQQGYYSKISRACLSRNRDLDGDTVIDEDEVRWYLATVGQYQGIWIGEDALPAEARLFDIREMKNIPTQANMNEYVRIYHYFTASNPEVFWPEEGGSTSSKDPDWSQATKVRCVRTLVSGSPEQPQIGTVDPDKYYFVENNVLNLTRLDQSVFRTQVQSSGMAPHYERDEQNKVFSKVEIQTTDLEGSFSIKDIQNVSAKEDVCARKFGDGWRVPNQRELILMMSTANDENSWYKNADSKSYWSNTLFNGSRWGGTDGRGYKPKNPGFASNPDGNITSEPSDGTPKVRCVRDIQ